MKNPKIVSLILEVYEDEKKEKICLIENIMKGRRTLYGLGKKQYIEVITDPVKHFDVLYDMSIDMLEALDIMTGLMINKALKARVLSLLP